MVQFKFYTTTHADKLFGVIMYTKYFGELKMRFETERKRYEFISRVLAT